MAQTINTNVASLNAQRNLTSSQSSLATSLQRLSSGLRVNSAKDDAAGLAISQRMNAQIKGLNQAARNANDGISMIQTAEGGMQQVQDMLIRMKELATQASSSTLGNDERGYIADEMTQLKDEIDNIATRTKFNGQDVLDGSFGKKLNMATTTASTGTPLSTAGAVTKVDISGAAASSTFTFTDGATSGELELSDGTTSQIIDISGVTLNTGESYTLNFNKLGVSITIAAAADGTGGDTLAAALDTLVVATGASTGAELQIGADNAANNRLTINLGDMRITSSSASEMLDLGTAISAFAGSESTTDAQALLDSLEDAINYVSTERASLGAQQNRLDYTISNIATQAENISASRGRIIDADFASETANLTRGQILQQAGTAMLAQANSLPQNVLSLLRG